MFNLLNSMFQTATRTEKRPFQSHLDRQLRHIQEDRDLPPAQREDYRRALLRSYLR